LWSVGEDFLLVLERNFNLRTKMTEQLLPLPWDELTSNLDLDNHPFAWSSKLGNQHPTVTTPQFQVWNSAFQPSVTGKHLLYLQDVY
jgi:hypothetical protein